MTNNSFEHFKGHEELISRIDDLVEQCITQHRPTSTHFLSESEADIAKRYLGNKYLYKIDGGHLNAMRVKVIFLPSEEDDFSDVVCLVARINQQFVKLNHRDVLGALMNLRIERNQIGDMWVEDKQIVIYTSSKIADFICLNLDQINRLHVSFAQTDQRLEMVINTQEITGTVNSERIDSLVAFLAKTSRKKAQEIIEQQYVKVNDDVLVDYSKLCNNNCTISIRKVGRFRYLGTMKTTKKDRLLVKFEKFL